MSLEKINRSDLIDIYRRGKNYLVLHKKWVISVSSVALFVLVYLLLYNNRDIFFETGFKRFYKPFENREEYKTARPAFSTYIELEEELPMANLNMIGWVDENGVRGKDIDEKLMGMILRTLRFKNITDKIERKYGLPDNVLMAMIMQESCGADLLLNSLNDGGAGLCHMQGYMARLFSLKVYMNCNEIRCLKHGNDLRRLINSSPMDRKFLYRYDERFHPILNLDAAGRMLAYYMAGPQTKISPFRTAICAYAGRYNYAAYFKSIMKYRRIIGDSRYIDQVRTEFNKRNRKLHIGSRLSDFDDYIQYHQRQNRNYGLDLY